LEKSYLKIDQKRGEELWGGGKGLKKYDGQERRGLVHKKKGTVEEKGWEGGVRTSVTR